jgi:O-antigen ligase
MRFWTVAGAYAVWLFAMEAVYYVLKESNETALQIAVLSGAIPAALQLLLLGLDTRGLATSTKISLLLLLAILLSYVANAVDASSAAIPSDAPAIPTAWLPIVFTLNTAFIFVIGIVLAGSPDRDLLRSAASIFCYLSAPFLLFATVSGEYVYGRLSANDLGPNIWGSFGLLLCLCAMGRRWGPLTILFFAIGASTILAASSRTSLVSIFAASLVLLIYFIAQLRGWGLAATLFVAGCIIMASALFLDPYVFEFISYVSDGLLQMDSADRGLGSGFTGRSTVWAQTLQLWMESPLVGLGFRQHESFLPDSVSAHNAYLAMLADTGLIGTFLYLALVLGALGSALTITDRASRRLIVATIVSYIVYGFFERRAINGGNPYSLLFLLACFYALCDGSLRRVGVLGPSEEGEDVALPRSLA